MANQETGLQSAAGPRPPVQFSRQWRALKGMAYGLPQSGLSGQLYLQEIGQSAVDHLIEAFACCFSEETPTLSPALATTDRFAHLLCYWIGALQRNASIAVAEKYHIVRQADSPAEDTVEFLVTLPFMTSRATTVAARWVAEAAIRLLNETSPESAQDTEPLVDSFNEVRHKLKSMVEQGLNDFYLLDAIYRLDIPLQRLSGRLLMLGTGRYVRWMSSTITDRTNPLGIDLLNDKQRTASFLNAIGLPGVKHKQVANAEEAAQAAQELGYPVVVKPADLEKGIGVYADLPDENRVRSAFAAASKVTDKVLVEQHAAGNTHRLTVFEGEIIRVLRRIPGGVTGDGVHNLKQLVELWHADPTNRRRAQRLGRTLLALDDEALDVLDQDGRTVNDIPPAGEFVRLRRRDNINTGGANEYLTVDHVHPENAQLALDIAALLKMDFVGVDLITTDIERSWRQTGGVICELNARPQMGAVQDRHLYERVLAGFMGNEYRVAATLGIYAHANTNIEGIINNLTLEESCNGVSSKAGLRINGSQVTGPFGDGFKAARALSIRPDVTGMFCLLSVQEILANGLPLGYWDSARLIDVGGNDGLDQAAVMQLKSMLAGHVEGEFKIDTGNRS